ncbi:MAG: mandelate racemase/muconate lactonizing enzyme family protein [Thermoanaerobaculia bacterium]
MNDVKIAHIETLPLAVPLQRPFHWSTGTATERRTTVVRVVTESGIEGWGETLLGDSAGAVEIATCDAAAREAGVPLAAMLAATPASSVPVYASGIYYDGGDPADEARRCIGAGFTHVKMKIGRGPSARDLARVAAVREAIGGAVLMADANGAYDLEDVLAIAPPLCELGVLWLEEPFPLDRHASYRELHRRALIAVAAGESLDAEALRRYLDPRAIDWAQPNVATCGGVRHTLAVLRRAIEAGVRPAIHAWGTPIMTAVSLHVAAASPRPALVEIDRTPNPLRAIATDPAASVHDGMVELSRGPGLGIDVDRAAVNAYRVRRTA